MITRNNKIIASLAFAVVAVTGANAQSLDALSVFNIITTGDFNSQSDIEGRTLVGGNFTNSNSTNFATRLDQNAQDQTDASLIVVGDIVNGNAINVLAGSVVVGGTVNGRNVQLNQNNRTVTFTENANINFDDTFTQLTLASQSLSTLAMNNGNTVVFPGNSGGTTTFNIGSGVAQDGLAVFNVTEDVFDTRLGNTIDITGVQNTNRDVVINVGSGDDGIVNIGTNFLNGFNQDANQVRIVFNFFDATEINIATNFFGNILAPNAEINPQANIDGSVFAESLTTQSELHIPTFDGNIEFEQVPYLIAYQVPEPSSTLLLGLGGLGLLIRRKR